ncbi:MAG: glutamyl-tRNA reductase [Salana multivorans]|uniref:glutamyl-tRNA reductase n=1 Tax=Salana multivorans TaxID=120377 RepID=UPI00095FF1CB|nr:glutamyl-tRNA reductase [Salana multivorans]MBN8881465.1 glutamyl-tRNA reductase [Salana multivorans]OJX96948.1 MAG: glutamyl-tRNA reductase [Micrococcales bacterium 73-15]
MLLAVSLTHTTAGFDLLEQATAAVAGTDAPGLALASMRPDGVRGAVVLSTCNRLEAYLDVDPDRVEDVDRELVEALARRLGMSAADLTTRVGHHVGPAVAQHLFAVSAGLDSLVVGEDEIAGQVQRAVAAARSAGTSTADLDQLFQRAASTSRQVRRTAGWDGSQTSVAHLALELISTRVADLASSRVLLVGTGAHARTAVRALAARGVRDVAVYSPSGRADAFAARHGLRAVAADAGALRGAVDASDVVVSCTSRHALGTGDVDATGRTRQLLVVDLGLPRTVDPALGRLPAVTVLDLATIGRHADLPGLGRDVVAESLVGEAVTRYSAAADAGPAVAALRRHVGDVLEEEIARARSRARDDDEAARTEAALRHLAGVLLHEPSIRAREAAATGGLETFVAGLRSVLGVEVADA